MGCLSNCNGCQNGEKGQLHLGLSLQPCNVHCIIVAKLDPTPSKDILAIIMNTSLVLVRMCCIVSKICSKRKWFFGG